MFLKLATLSLVMFTALTARAQNKLVADPRREIATNELEEVIAEASKLNDPFSIVTVKARAAALISYSDPARADALFLQVWKFTNEQKGEEFDKELAKVVILKELFPRNPKLGRQLLADQPKRETSSSQPGAFPAEEDQELATGLAAQLAETDPSTAAALLEKSLSNLATPGGVGPLFRLREKDSLLADYVATKAIEAIAARPTIVSLFGLHSLGAYVFAGGETSFGSMERDSSLQALQFKYFVACNDVLRASLNETNQILVKDQHYTPAQLQFRAAYQAQIAAVLAAIAPRFQPALAAELAAVANKLTPQIPENIAKASQFMLTRISGNPSTSEDPETNFFLTLSQGDFDEANRFLDRLASEKKAVYGQLLIKAQARALLAQGDVMAALTAIRTLEDHATRLVMYLDALKATRKKRDADVMTIIINEARLLVPQTNRNGIHVRALLSFAAQIMTPETKDDGMQFLTNAVTSINALSTKSNDRSQTRTSAEAAMAELNDPNSLLDAPEMERAFSAAGLSDLEAAIAQAKRIEVKPVQLVARLVTVQATIKRLSQKPKPPSKAASVSTKPQQ